MDTAKLLTILDALYGSFPYLERVGIYGSPQNLLHKTHEELVSLEAGLKIVYLGVETGNRVYPGSAKELPEEVIRRAERLRLPVLFFPLPSLMALAEEKKWPNMLMIQPYLNEIDRLFGVVDTYGL